MLRLLKKIFGTVMIKVQCMAFLTWKDSWEIAEDIVLQEEREHK